MIEVSVRLFAGLRERAGAKELRVELPDGARAADAYAALGLGPEPPGLSYAVNRSYVPRDAPVQAGDEVALIPPVSGGAQEQSERASVRASLRAEPLDLGRLVEEVADPGAGATATFLGTVRDNARGRRVEWLEYEAFDEMAVEELERIGSEAARAHGCLRVAIAHRTGRVAIGEASVAIAVSAAHRAAALDGCREIIEALKRSVPIWKKERYEGGSEWIGQGS